MALQVHLPETAPASTRLNHARQVIRAEAAALELAAQRLDECFVPAVELIRAGTRSTPHQGRRAVALAPSRDRHFPREDFAPFPPAGSLGRKLLKVDAVMREGNDLRLAGADETVRTVFARSRQGGRRTGAVMLVDEEGRLCGL